MKVAIIGGGVMGEAIVSALLSHGLIPPEEILVAEPSIERRAALAEKHGVLVTEDNLDTVESPIVVLAIKPQDLAAVLSQLRGQLHQDQLCLSIVAGATLDRLCFGLVHEAVVRAMPNAPAQIGQGMTVWITTAQVSALQRGWTQQILGALGQELRVAEETYLDMATAISASGPAYVFLFMQALIDAGVHLGLPRAMAEILVNQMLSGSVALVQASGHTLSELRHLVTSPGGTTTEALLVLEEGALRALLTKATIAAYKKSQALGGSSHK